MGQGSNFYICCWLFAQKKPKPTNQQQQKPKTKQKKKPKNHKTKHNKTGGATIQSSVTVGL